MVWEIIYSFSPEESLRKIEKRRAEKFIYLLSGRKYEQEENISPLEVEHSKRRESIEKKNYEISC